MTQPPQGQQLEIVRQQQGADGFYRGPTADLSAVGVNLTAVGVGTVQLTGDAFASVTGKYAIDSGRWNTVPVWTVTKQFGVQPAPAP